MKEEAIVNPRVFICNKWKQLYVKLLVFYAIFIILHNFFFKIGFYNTEALYVGKHIVPYTSFKDYLVACGWAVVAAREPFLGAMWFVNLLFIGLCIISIITFVLSKTKFRNDEHARGFVILLLCVASCYLSHVVGISILRFTPALCGSWLIYCGYLVNKKYKISYDNVFVFLGAVLLMFEMCSVFGEVSMANDIYGDAVILTVGTLCSLYVLCFIAKKIEKSVVGSLFALCGRESYYIMALHLLGFKIGTILLYIMGICKPWAEIHSPAANLSEWILYILSGISFSLIIAKLVKYFKLFLKKL